MQIRFFLIEKVLRNQESINTLILILRFKKYTLVYKVLYTKMVITILANVIHKTKIKK